VPILNVDDDPPTRFFRSRILERAGFEVREAASVQQALEYGLAKPPPDLILLDVALPDGDGFTVCEQIKTAHPEIPVVLITTIYQDSESRREGFRAGADEYLLAPVEPDRLVDVVSRFLSPTHVVGAQAPATLITDRAGLIISANGAAARLLNLTTLGARERSLLTFFEEQRHQVAMHMERAAAGRAQQFSSRIRPRDRRPFDVQVDVSAAEFERGGALEWALEPLPVKS
jgi:DNA-binding response OmpR family regulator